jgi:hypothetical protein
MDNVNPAPAQLAKNISLEILLSASSVTNDRSKKAAPKSYLFLALILAPTLRLGKNPLIQDRARIGA